MKLREYIQEFMSDVLELRDAMFDGIDGIFSFDGFDYNENGELVKVIYDSQGKQIELEDILHLDKSDFIKKYTFKSAEEALEKYLAAYKIISAEELLKSFKQDIVEAKKKLNRFRDIDAFELMGIQF